MTLIAPIDTGAWEGSCNSSFGKGGMMNPGANPCTKLETEEQCNGDGGAPPSASRLNKACDWRGGRCVDTAIERKECRVARTQAECARALGPDNPFQSYRPDAHR